MKITKGMRIRFENGSDILEGTVIGKFVDSTRPDMEETWTVFADSVLVKEPTGELAPGQPRKDRNGDPVLDAKGQPKLTAPTPVVAEKWLRLVDDDGVQTIEHPNFAGDPLQLVKHGVPVPFRVRARRMTVV